MSGLIINPGSAISAFAGEGWTNTYEGAVQEAERYLTQMHEDGITEVVLMLPGRQNERRWVFGFRHTVTGKVVELETHGIDDHDAYCKQFLFTPKVYWAGSSCKDPKLEDWAAPGFAALKTFVPIDSAA